MLCKLLALLAMQESDSVGIQNRSRVLMQRLQSDLINRRPSRLSHRAPNRVVARVTDPTVVDRRDNERPLVGTQHNAAQLQWVLDTRHLRHATYAWTVAHRRRDVDSECGQP